MSARDMYAPTFHRDGSVTVWNVFTQRWERTRRPSDRVLASLSCEVRRRVWDHIHPATTPGDVVALRAEALAAGDTEQVKICDRALRGSRRALRESRRVILEVLC